MVFAWLLALLTAIVWQIVAVYMYQFISITNGQLWPPPASFVRDTEKSSTVALVVTVFFYTSLWAVKLAFLLFFRRLGHNVTGQKVLWWLVCIFTLAAYVVCIGTIPYSCLAVPLPELVRNLSTEGAIRFQRANLIFSCGADVLTDYMSQLSFSFSGILANRPSHGNPNQDALESPNVVTEENGPRQRLLPRYDHHSLRHRSRRKHQCFNQTA